MPTDVQINFSSDLHFQNGLIYATRNVTDMTLSPFQLTQNSGPYGGKDYMIIINTTNPITFNLPTDSINGCENGRQYYITSAIQDTPISVTINGGTNLINGTDSYSFSPDTQSIQIMFADITSEWYIV